AAAFRESLRLRPDAARAHHHLAVTLERLSRYDDAAAAFREAIRLRPTYLHAHLGLAATLRRQGRWAEEAAAYADALRVSPDDAPAGPRGRAVLAGAIPGGRGHLSRCRPHQARVRARSRRPG